MKKKKNKKSPQQVSYLRQLDILAPEKLKHFQFTVIGAGGIGSAVALVLSKMGVDVKKMTIYDPDTVAEHNLPNQMFLAEHLNLPKVEALKSVIERFVGEAPVVHQEAITGTELLTGVVIAAVDSIEARKAIWEALRLNARCPLYIDARMGGLAGVIYSIRPHNPDDVELYESSLHEASSAVEEPCTARAIIFNTWLVAALVANQIRKYIVKEPFSRVISFDLRHPQQLLELDMQSGDSTQFR